MTSSSFSLLNPGGSETRRPPERLSKECVDDLCLADIADRIATDGISRGETLEILRDLTTNTVAIEYRQDILSDFMESPGFTTEIKAIMPKVTEMTWYSDTHRDQSSPLLQAIWRLGELELYVECLEGLHETFDRWSTTIRATGLRGLQELVEERRSTRDYASLWEELPKLREGLKRRKSVTLGINLDDRLRPVEAVLLSVNDQHYREQALMARLFRSEAAGGEFESRLPLHQTPRPTNHGLYPTGAFPLAPLFQDLEKLLSSLSRPLVSHIRAYVRVNTQFLDGVRKEIAFYIGAAEMLTELRSHGLPLCVPQIVPAERRTLHATEFYNLHLALLFADQDRESLRQKVITNDVEMGDTGRILILTGPNQGGKTTFTQGVGLLQVFGQAGLLVPAREATISPVDHVITHFPIRESNELEQGRLAEEASRLSRLFSTITDRSLILLNESLSSTSPGEGLYLAEDIVRAFRMVGLRAIFATHLHELAYRIEDINRTTVGDARLVSVVAGVAEEDGSSEPDGMARRTYKITVGPPIGKSYARDIAERFGISIERIRTELRKRGVLE